MKLGVFTALFRDKSFEESVKYLKSIGVQAVEVGAGGYPGDHHINSAEFLADPNKIEGFQRILKENDMLISAISCHGNPLHPQKEIAEKFHNDFKNAILVAEKLGVKTICGFSGCPGDQDGAKYPNWVTCAWPHDYEKVLEYQWKEKLVPYWKEMCKFASEHGIQRIAFEMHPGFCVYNPASLIRLREEVGSDLIGANFDPSHLFWQGIDPVQAIYALKGMIYHFHAKDTYLDKAKIAVNGVLDTTRLSNVTERNWLFRSVGYGHDDKVWKDIVSALRMVDYDFVMSIEHEDALMTENEGLEKAVSFLLNVMTFESKSGNLFWA